MRKKSIVILSIICLIVTLVVAVLGYLVKQEKSFGQKEIANTKNVENEIYKVAVEENEESKLNSIKARELAKTSAGVTIQQGNIVVYMDTTLGIDPSIANYRTEYGVGETVAIKVYFDKEIKSVSTDTSLYLKFGTGTERKIGVFEKNGSELIFK